MIERLALGRVALAATLACGMLAYLRPVLGELRAPNPRPANASLRLLPTGADELAERSLYRLAASFQSDERRVVHLPELRGHFQVLALIFTRCPSVCPTLVRELHALERAMPKNVREATRFTLVSIDPTHDTPEALAAYRAKLGLSLERWLLLRGEPDSVRELSALLGFAYPSDGSMPLAHSKLVTVLNRDGEIIHQQQSVSADPQRIIDALARSL